MQCACEDTNQYQISRARLTKISVTVLQKEGPPFLYTFSSPKKSAVPQKDVDRSFSHKESLFFFCGHPCNTTEPALVVSLVFGHFRAFCLQDMNKPHSNKKKTGTNRTHCNNLLHKMSSVTVQKYTRVKSALFSGGKLVLSVVCTENFWFQSTRFLLQDKRFTGTTHAAAAAGVSTTRRSSAPPRFRRRAREARCRAERREP